MASLSPRSFGAQSVHTCQLLYNDIFKLPTLSEVHTVRPVTTDDPQSESPPAWEY